MGLVRSEISSPVRMSCTDGVLGGSFFGRFCAASEARRRRSGACLFDGLVNGVDVLLHGQQVVAGRVSALHARLRA